MWQLKQGDPSKPTKSWGQWLTDMFNPVSTEWFQSINALAIFILAPVFAFMWVWMARRKIQPSIPTKMACGVLLMSAAFAVMIVGAQSENGPTSVPFDGQFPQFVEVRDNGQLWVLEAGKKYDDREPTPCQAGRLRWDAESRTLQMTGVLADVERDRIVRQTAPAGWFEAVKQLQEQTQKQKKAGQEIHAEVKVVQTPPGLDMHYAGFHPDVVSYDEKTQTLKANAIELADKDVKALLLAAGDPHFRAAMDQLYVKSSEHRVSSWWLFWFYILATLGELCLSPVGLSMVSKLAPARYATMLMGLWLLTSFFGNFAAGAMGELWGSAAGGVIWSPTPYFIFLAAVLAAAAVVLFLLVRKVVAMMHGVN
jgi:POT family proton-dependent oligopeptide transporter